MTRVIAAGTFDAEFGRNRRLIGALERAGYEVETCHANLYGQTRYDLVGKPKRALIVRGLVAYARLVWRFLRVPRGDVVLVLYPGWFDMIVLGPIARARRMPVVFDIYISLSDTIVADREIASARSLLGRVSRIVDWLSIRSASRLLADTPEHADLYARLGGIPRDRIGVVWVGAEDAVFHPRPDIEPEARRVLFYGTFIKLHGVDVIVRAAKLLERESVEFRIIGTGQELESIQRLVEQLDPSNIEMIGRVSLNELAEQVAAATVCCGIFGQSEKASRVVPNKVFECVAVGRPVVTGDTPAMRNAFSETELDLVPPGDPDALAGAIRALLADPARRQAMTAAARKHYLAAYAENSLSRMLEDEIRAAIEGAGRRPHSLRRR